MSTYVDSVCRRARTFTQEEKHAMLRASGSHVAGWRDHCLLSLLFGNGLRQHEAVALNIGDVFDREGRAKCRLELRVFKGCKREGARRRRVPQEIVLSDSLRRKLEQLYQLRVRAGEVLTPDTPLFVSRKHGRLSTRQVRRLFREWQFRAGMDDPHNCHIARHTACSDVYEETNDLLVTQVFARHDVVTSTQIYTHPRIERLVAALDRIAEVRPRVGRNYARRDSRRAVHV